MQNTAQFATHRLSFLLIALLVVGILAPMADAADVTFTVRSAHDGNWSDPGTWAGHRVPSTGDVVQIRAGTKIIYDAVSDAVIRDIHVAGTLTFARDRSTRLTVGLIKVQPGETMSEDGFNCDDHPTPAPANLAGIPTPALEIGTLDQPIPAQFTATIRLAFVNGMNTETCPAIIDCGGRWDAHGAPMSRTWVKLGAEAAAGSTSVAPLEKLAGWHVGDHVIVTGSSLAEEVDHTFAKGKDAQRIQTEENSITSIDDDHVTFAKPLRFMHRGSGAMRSEIANLSRNVVIESADPTGVRGHTMYHAGSSGGISYAEFRHLGKQGVLGKYAIHFHLCGSSMRGSGVVGASVWDSANRWVTIHGTDHLLVRDCVGFGSIGHGFFLEDGTEAYNILDRNLAVHAYKGKPLPKQLLPFDSNDGAGFWWAAGRNTIVRNVSCENDQYGYHFDQSESSREDFRRPLEMPDGSTAHLDIRTIPFFRFEDNESHCDGLYSFNFGVDRNGAVHGDRQHPFACRNLRSWETHYALKPLLQFFLMDGLSMINNVYGVYQPDYDAHVYRNIYLNHVTEEPINRAHDDEDNQFGNFTYENLTLENCRGTLIQVTSTAPSPGVTGHFRNVVVRDTDLPARDRAIVDIGSGTINDKLQNPVAYYFHDLFKAGQTVKVVTTQYPDQQPLETFASPPGFAGPQVRARVVSDIAFPILLDPVDDLPPATIITAWHRDGGSVVVTGLTTDNGQVASVRVNGSPATITASGAGTVDWTATVHPTAGGTIVAAATDATGNTETNGHEIHVTDGR